MTRTQSSPRIATLHPDPDKQGVDIDARKYTTMRRALLQVIPTRSPGIAFADLVDLVRPLLPTAVYDCEVSIAWYVVTVKLDLEARGLVARSHERGAQRLIRRKAKS